MGCCGKHRRKEPTTIERAAAELKSEAVKVKADSTQTGDSVIYPATGCELCAEKHLSTAYALAGEAGYVPINRQRIIGELTACALHLYKEHKELSEKVRTIRHLIQQRREAEVDWHPLLTAMDALATAAANENVKPEESPK